jgi:hypothetical protein
MSARTAPETPSKPRLPRHLVGDILIHLLQTPAYDQMNGVAWGECDLLDDIIHMLAQPLETPIQAFGPTPLVRHTYVLNRLEHDARFRKSLFRVWIGNREGQARAFRLTQPLETFISAPGNQEGGAMSKSWGGKRTGAGRPFRQRLRLSEPGGRELADLTKRLRKARNSPDLREEEIVEELIHEALQKLAPPPPSE